MATENEAKLIRQLEEVVSLMESNPQGVQHPWIPGIHARPLLEKIRATLKEVAIEEQPTAKIFRFNGVTKLDLPPDQILEQAIGELEGVVIVGFAKDDQSFYGASSYADGGTALWLLELCKLKLFESSND